MIHRIVRLYPLYLLGIVARLRAAARSGDRRRRCRRATPDTLALQFIPELFVLPAPEALGSQHAYPLNVPAWTLFFELLVNLVYVVAFRWLRDTRDAGRCDRAVRGRP